MGRFFADTLSVPHGDQMVKKSALKTWVPLVLSGLVLLLYQNCGEGFDSADLNLSSESSQIDNHEDPAPPPPPPPPSSTPYTAILTWDESQAAGLAGYNIYFGTNSANLSQKVDVKKPEAVGGIVSYQLADLNRGVKYYFAVTAYDKSSESAKSKIVEFTPPQ